MEINNIEILDINYKKTKKYTDDQRLELEECWKNLYDEFYNHRDNKSGKYSMDKNNELVRMSLILDLLSDIENRLILLINMESQKELQTFIINRTTEAINDFRKLYPKVKVNMFDSPLELLTVVQSVIKSQTNIFDEKMGVKEKTIIKQKETIYDVVSIMSKYLGYNLDVNNISCMEFLAHEKTINSLSKADKTK